MNFFGHAWMASRVEPVPEFVLGAMLPDLVGMAGLQAPRIDAPQVEAGRRHHVAVDLAFHRLPRFLSWMGEARAALAARGLRRGAVLGASHVGVELLLDGVLSRWDPGRRPYDLALAHAAEAAALSFESAEDGERFRDVVDRIGSGPLPEAYRDPAAATGRLVRVLTRRPRLAPTADEAEAIGAWMEEAAPVVAAEAEALVRELDRALP